LGILGSRQSPWEDRISSVKQHPWFGTGFGTSDLGNDRPHIQGSSIYTTEGTVLVMPHQVWVLSLLSIVLLREMGVHRRPVLVNASRS
jgi:O-antigen ligase